MTRRQVLTGTGDAQSQIFIDDGIGGSAASSLIVQDEGVVIVAAAATMNFIGPGVSVVANGGTQADVRIGSEIVTTTGAPTAGQLAKISGTNTYTTLDVAGGDDPDEMVGVFLTTAVANSAVIQFEIGPLVTMISDGSGVIANNAKVEPSIITAGAIRPAPGGSTVWVGRNAGASVAATPGLSVSVR